MQRPIMPNIPNPLLLSDQGVSLYQGGASTQGHNPLLQSPIPQGYPQDQGVVSQGGASLQSPRYEPPPLRPMIQAPTRIAGQDWRRFLDLAAPDWRYTTAPTGRPFFVQGRSPNMVQGSIPAEGLHITLAEFKCNSTEFSCVQMAGVEAYLRAPNQALGTPSVKIPTADLGMGVWWEITFRRISQNSEARGSATLRGFEGEIVGDPRNGFTHLGFLSINDGWNPLVFEEEGLLSLTLHAVDFGFYAENAILFFQAQMAGYSALIPSTQQNPDYPYGKANGRAESNWNPLLRNR